MWVNSKAANKLVWKIWKISQIPPRKIYRNHSNHHHKSSIYPKICHKVPINVSKRQQCQTSISMPGSVEPTACRHSSRGKAAQVARALTASKAVAARTACMARRHAARRPKEPSKALRWNTSGRTSTWLNKWFQHLMTSSPSWWERIQDNPAAVSLHARLLEKTCYQAQCNVFCIAASCSEEAGHRGRTRW